MKSDQETHAARLTLGEYLVGVDVFFYFRDCSLNFILFERLYFIFFICGLKLSYSYYVLKLNSYQILK
jgi:putative effector of murein hydrolase